MQTFGYRQQRLQMLTWSQSLTLAERKQNVYRSLLVAPTVILPAAVAEVIALMSVSIEHLEWLLKVAAEATTAYENLDEEVTQMYFKACRYMSDYALRDEFNILMVAINGVKHDMTNFDAERCMLMLVPDHESEIETDEAREIAARDIVLVEMKTDHFKQRVERIKQWAYMYFQL